MIDEQLHRVWVGGCQNGFLYGTQADFVQSETLTAIYEIGLECIGAAEISNVHQFKGYTSGLITPEMEIRNELRASQRKAWAKACGVAEK